MNKSSGAVQRFQLWDWFVDERNAGCECVGTVVAVGRGSVRIGTGQQRPASLGMTILMDWD